MILRDYQEQISSKAACCLQSIGLCYLSMECRTGKTVTALAAASKFGARSVLFITKLKAIPSIEADYLAMGQPFQLRVTNYESAHKISDFGADLIVLDEAHSIGAFPKPSKRQQVCRQLCMGRPVLFLSGTPSPEGYSQLYHQMQVSDSSPWAIYSTFYRWAKAGYVSIQQRMVNGRLLNDYSRADGSRIMSELSPFLLSYSQQQAGFEACITEHDLQVSMGQQTAEAIRALQRDRICQLADGSTIIADTPASLLNKIHQLSGGTAIDEAGQRHIIDSSKAEAIASRFAGRKIAIFYCYQAEGDLLRQVFASHTDSPETFQRTGADVVFIDQVRRAREGTRLDSAEAIVFYSTEYSYLSYEQARQRGMSKERQQQVDVYYCVGSAGIDADILQAVRDKQDFTLAYYSREQRGKARITARESRKKAENH